MITNNSSENPKSVKGSKDPNSVSGGADVEEDKKERLYKSNSSKDCVREPRGRNNFYGHFSNRGRGDSIRGKGRGRSRDDFGSGRGRFYDDRKGGYRGRSGRRGRDDESGYSGRSRFQEPLSKIRSDVVVSASSSKFFSCGDYRGSKPGIPEDSRISITLRRMGREEDEISFNNLCKLLQDSLTLPDNEVYIRRSLEIIDESLYEILRIGQKESIKLDTAKCLGHVGYNLGKDVKRFMDWIFRKINHENNNIIKEYLLRGIHELVLLDSKSPTLGEYSKPLMKELHKIMESTEIADIYILTAETILLLTKRYPFHFTELFRDTIDIMVGWHIDGAEPGIVAEFSSDCLRSLSPYWIQDVCFTVSLLGQILEDTQSYCEDVLKDANTSNSEPFAKTTAFIRVFRAVFEGAKDAMDPSKCKQITWTFHSDAITQIFNTVLKMTEVLVYCPLIEAGNKCAVAIMAYLRYKTEQVQSTLFSYICKQLELGKDLDQETLRSLLNLISKVMGEGGLQLPAELIDKMFAADSFILTLRFTPLSREVIDVYKALLKRKDINLIKATYKHMLDDLDSALVVISPNLEALSPSIDRTLHRTSYSKSQIETVIKFYFEAFKHMSKRGGSLIWIYLLKPNLFDLLAIKIVPLFCPLEYPSLFHYLLVLLRDHCSSYGEFVMTSGLLNWSRGRPRTDGLQPVASVEPSNSPTTNHLSVILTLIGKSLRLVMSEDSKLLMLRWSGQILDKCKKFLSEILCTDEMSCLVSGICRAAVDKSRRIALAAAKALYKLIYHHRGPWKKEYLVKFINLCTFFINSPSKELQKKYLSLIPLLPSLNIIFGVEVYSKDPKGYNKSLEMCLYSAMNRGDTGEIQDLHFRKFMAYIFHGVPKRCCKEWLEEMVCRCWAVLEIYLGQRSMGSEQALLDWGTWQCAQLTVLQKLKTPLGKPAETLVSIESAIRILSKEVVTQVCSKEWKTPMTGERVRLLIQFVEHLEKAVYNSVDGTASAMAPSHQGIKCFFMTNKATCTEWLNRVRLPLMFVCIHAGLGTYAVRHGYAFLQSLVDSNNTQSSDFETGLIYVGWALTNLNEPEALRGLYVWAKELQGTKLPVLKPLIDKAAHRYENSITGFQSLLTNTAGSEQNEASDSELEVPSNSLRTFIADQLTESYLALNDWSELQAWKMKEKEYLSQENGNSLQLYKYITEDYVGALKLVEKGEVSAASSLLDWKVGKPMGKSTPKWNHYGALQVANFYLSRAAISSLSIGKLCLSKGMKEKVEGCSELIDRIMKEVVKDPPSELLGRALVLKFVAASLTTDINHLDNQLTDLDVDVKKRLRSLELGQVLWWSALLGEMKKRVDNSSFSPHFHLKIAVVARKEGNLGLARTCLLKHFKVHGLCTGLQMSCSLTDMADSILEFRESHFEATISEALEHLSKQLYIEGDEVKAGEVAVKCMLGAEAERRGKLLARLARWLTSTSQATSLVGHPNLTQVLESDSDIPSLEAIDLNCYLSDKSGLSKEDSLVGEVLKKSLALYPGQAKAWTQMADLAYSWAKKLAGRPPPDLTHADLPPATDPAFIANLIASTPPNIHLDDIDMEASSGVESFIMQLSEAGQLSQEQMDSVVNLWRQNHSPIYNYFTLAAYSYFKFLQMDPYQDRVVLATLRLVRLLVKHASEMEPLYQFLLPLSPTSAWVCVVPQLFSRLSHPLPHPRRKIAELLVRIGTDYPHLITFPAVVGSSTNASTIRDMPDTKLFATNQNIEDNEMKDDEIDDEVKFFDDEEDPENYDDDESTNKDETSVILENSFMTIVDSLSKQCGGGIISEVGVLVSELRRITVLWDELWLGTLKQRHADIARRFNQLTAETEVTLANQHLSQETKDTIILDKHRLILKPLLFVLEQLHRITSVLPETPHEQKFQDKFGLIIEETLKELREPVNPKCPEEACNALKRLEKALCETSEGKPSVYLMSEISPVLANLTNTKIAMPGLPTPHVTIKSVVNTVPVLATMTKPKKLVFVGSDGKEYTYLFKGLEDLHLDERIMQFLSTANSMLREDKLRARHYSVIPLGPRSGLISWVDSVTPIFSIYKRWQQRDSQTPNPPNWCGGVARPSELFYSVLTPLLTEAGLKPEPMNRSAWPLYILKKALSQLSKQTPPYLLSKELWCYSGSAGTWWESTKLYSTSLAVMSMIGYIIGLGDRHLDNVLVNLRTGQVVHIDYNVCFEKGKTLRVPEKVPYRLTPNLVSALGVTGIEGVFRLTCEIVLEVLQKEKETLLTLLEAFVYDPLIDWTPMNEAGYTGAVYGGGRGMGQEIKQTRRQLEREVTLAMFSVRVIEISHEWTLNKEKVESELKEFLKFLEQWLSSSEKLSGLMSKLQQRHSQMALLKEAEGQPEHSIYTLGSRYEKYRNTFGAKLQVTTSLKNKIQECDLQLTQYQGVIEIMRRQEVTNWLREVNCRPKQEVCTVFDLIKEFLQNAGQSQTVIQCAESEIQVSALCCEQSELTASLINMLLQYWEVVKNFPASYIHSHRSALYKKWAIMLLEDMSPHCCSEVDFEMGRELSLHEEEMMTRSRYYTDLLNETLEAARPIPVPPPLPPTSPNLASIASSKENLSSAVAAMLIQYNSKFLKLESTATGCGDFLVNLMSQEGDWFLDDMVLISTVIQELLGLLPSDHPQESLQPVLEILSILHTKYLALQDLDVNLRSIILPEALQAMRSENQSVLMAADVLDNLANSAGLPLRELGDNLERHLKFTILSVNSPHEDLLPIAEKLHSGFLRIIKSLKCSTMQLAPGEMLVLGFNGLFSELLAPDSLPALIASLHLPPPWASIDHIIDAKTYAMRVSSNQELAHLVELVFSVKRIMAMVETLGSCRLDADGWKTGCRPPANPAIHARPVRVFIADYVRNRLIGLVPHVTALAIIHLLNSNGLDFNSEIEKKEAQNRIPINELYEKFIEGESVGWKETRSVVERAAEDWMQRGLSLRREREAKQTTSVIHRQSFLATSYHWLYGHYLLAAPQPPLNRGHFIMEFRKNMTALLSVQGKIKEAVEQQKTLIASVEQRLKWAAGANPALIEVLSAFENSVSSHREKMAEEQQMAVDVGNMANWVLAHEMLRTPTPEALTHDTSFAMLVEECGKAVYMCQKNQVDMTPVEEGLVALSPPPLNSNQEWISRAEKQVSDCIHQLNKELDPLQKDLFATEDCIKNKSLTLRYEMGKHNRIVSDIRELFKTMIKFEDAAEMGLDRYLLRYKEYTDKMSKMTKRFTIPEPFSEKRLKEAVEDGTSLLEKTRDIYEDLLKFSFSDNPQKELSSAELKKKKLRKLVHTKSVQEKNSYAVGVWRRIKLKLEGRDPDPGVRASIQHQVKWTINEATSADNLATLYEGWTPWV